MPIVVAVLGVIMVVLAVLLFTLSPAEKTAPVVETQEVNRTETMEAEEEAVVETEPLLDVETSLMAKTYTGSGTYLTPARTNHKIDVSLTVEDGIVTAADVIYDGGEGFSNPNQERFDGAFEAQVVGKSLDSISLSRVGGASLTSEAFNQAVVAIRAQQS